ncbi:MAG: radical SAM protein [Spirochaetes bacterium]|nr:radical SAM protein [Spirochaetota bacterium]
MNHNKKRIYLINPHNPDNFWTMQSSVKAVGAKTLMPNAALATLISLTPKDLDIEYIYCDENIAKIDWNIKCDLVAVTGYTLHSQRITEICNEFRKHNVPVALGGTFATLHREYARKLADHLFIYEAEYTWPQFLKEWVNGKAKDLYVQKEHIDMEDSPAPDWSFINGREYLYFTVQTSRGCPNNCDFCDAVKLVGHKYRTKSIEQIMAEIKNAYNAGAETIFFSEDNFFVKKSFTVELLTEIIKLNTSLPTPLSFSAQATIKIGNDEEILKLLADARFSVIFLGVESIKKECLNEINKGHIYHFNPVKAVSKMSSYGIIPFVGLIVGFDNDTISTFQELEEFLLSTASPIASISVLNAPENTTLYKRMKKAGRINENFQGLWHFSTNIKPTSMPLSELITRHRKLFKNLYEPENFEARALDWMKNIKYYTSLYKNSKTNFSKLCKFFYILKYYILNEPLPVIRMFFRLINKSRKINPRLIKKSITLLSQYCHYYDFANNASWQNLKDEV